MTKSRDPIAVTGIGCLCPLGDDPDAAFSRYRSGVSAVQLLDQPWASDLPSRMAAPVAFDLEGALGEFLSNRLDRCGLLAVVAARQAWSSAGLTSSHAFSGERIAVVFGTGIGGQSSLLQQHERFLAQAKRGHPLAVVMAMPNASSAQLAIEIGASGGAHTPVSACASGAEAIAWGRMLLAADAADVVLVGGTEAVIHPVNLRGFGEMRALSSDHANPAGACRPFAANRTGFVLGEGAGALVLERLSDAQARRAPIQGVLLGAGMTSDARHLAAPDPDGQQSAQAMLKAMRAADVSPVDIAMISAHATGTRLGDLAEARAIHQAFGSTADQVWVTAPKAGLGHLLGAAGAVESILTLKALQNAVVPRSLNCEPADPELRLRIAQDGNQALPQGVRRLALKNTFGFGGHNVSLLWASP